MSQSGLDADVLPAPGRLLHPGDHDGQAGHGEGPGLQAEEAEAGGHGCPLRFADLITRQIEDVIFNAFGNQR